jgi:hypothetical protein
MSSGFSGSPSDYRVTAAFTQLSYFGTDNENVPLFLITDKTATTFVINLFNDQNNPVVFNGVVTPNDVIVDWIAMPTK